MCLAESSPHTSRCLSRRCGRRCPLSAADCPVYADSNCASCCAPSPELGLAPPRPDRATTASKEKTCAQQRPPATGGGIIGTHDRDAHHDVVPGSWPRACYRANLDHDAAAASGAWLCDRRSLPLGWTKRPRRHPEPALPSTIPHPPPAGSTQRRTADPTIAAKRGPRTRRADVSDEKTAAHRSHIPASGATPRERLHWCFVISSRHRPPQPHPGRQNRVRRPRRNAARQSPRCQRSSTPRAASGSP
jgi:hypothetical protein